MDQCPRCGMTFNFFRRITGEAKEHIRTCTTPEKKKDLSYLAGTCRGCPANCFEKGEFAQKK